MRFSDITTRLADTGGAKWALHQRCRELVAEGIDIIELTIGEPDIPPDPSLIRVAHEAMLDGRVGYSDGRGEPQLIDALIRRYQKRRPDISRENILCFPGAQTALFASLLGITNAGDGVMTGDPVYAAYEGLIRASDAHMISVPLRPENDFNITAEDIEAAITPSARVLLLNSPHNPTGAVLDEQTIREIGHICQNHNLWLICDEVYEALIFEETFFSPFDMVEFSDRVVSISSISKSYAAPGFRSGWAVGSKEFCDHILPLSETMLFGNQPFIADMTAWALDHDIPTARKMREGYQRRATIVVKHLTAIAGIKPIMPKAGMFIVIDVSATGLDGNEFAWQLLDQGVAVMPGSSFGTNAKNLVRLSLTVPDQTIEQACHRIKLFVGDL